MQCPVEKLQEFKRNAQNILSLDDSIDEEGNNRLAFMEDTSIKPLEEHMLDAQRVEAIKNCVKELPRVKEQIVIVLRFGLQGSLYSIETITSRLQKMTNKPLGTPLIEAKTLRKLRQETSSLILTLLQPILRNVLRFAPLSTMVTLVRFLTPKKGGYDASRTRHRS